MENDVWQTVIETDLESMVAGLSPIRRQAFVANLMAKYGGDWHQAERKMAAATPIYAETSWQQQLEWLPAAS